MNLIAVYISTRGPLYNRCINFHHNYQLRCTEKHFELVLKEEEREQEAPFWSRLFENTTASVDNVNLIIGENGSGKTSLVFLLESMLVQLAHEGETDSSLFSGFSIWEEDRGVGESGNRRLYLFHTSEQPPQIKVSAEKRTLIINSVRNAKENLGAGGGLPAQMILVSASFENRFFELAEAANTLEGNPAFQNQTSAALLDLTPQRLLRKGFDVMHWLPEESVYQKKPSFSSKLGPMLLQPGLEEVRRNQGDYDTLGKPDPVLGVKSNAKTVKTVEAFFASQICYLIEGCTYGITNFLVPKGCEQGDNPAVQAHLVLLDSTGGQNQLKKRLSNLKQELSQSRDWGKGSSVLPFLNTAIHSFGKKRSFRDQQLECLCLHLLAECQRYLDSGEANGPRKHVFWRFLNILKQLLRTNIQETERAEWYLLQRLFKMHSTLLREMAFFDDEPLTNLRVAVEQGIAYLTFQAVFAAPAKQTVDRMSLSLSQVEELADSKRGEPTAYPVVPTVAAYLAYSLLDENKDTLWKMPTLRMEASSGQLNLLMLASYLRIITNGQSAVTMGVSNILMVDEADLSFHPEWQRTFLYRLLNMLYQIDATHWHVMITSHSPILVSDFPRSNIISLRESRGETGPADKNPADEKAETFAQNIYSIYGDEMYLTSAVGEFARQYLKLLGEKIEKLEEDEQNLKQITDMINRIGDQLLRRAYLNYLDEKRWMMFHELARKAMDDEDAENDALKKKLRELLVIQDQRGYGTPW